MRVAQVATAAGPVREDRTGSIESLVWLLSRELLALGHEVTVFGCAGAELPPGAEFVQTLPGSYGSPQTPGDWQVCEAVTLGHAVARSQDFDVLHSHAYLWGLPWGPVARAPMVHTMHTCPYDDEALLWALYPDAIVTAISRSQWQDAPPIHPAPAAVIHHGVDTGQFTFRAVPDDYACYLGRFIPGKGPREAIVAARELGIPLVLAGPVSDYFNAEIRPLVDGRNVRYVGEVDRRQRDALLGGARVLLYPLLAPEPFGLVQVEAMLCGTPVAAAAIGAVPELVAEGVSGCLAETAAEVAGAAARAMTLDRCGVRAYAEGRFAAGRMAAKYAEVYAAAIARRSRT
jgi:glycosyltransferase involved in cell wall biosynthesis